MTSHGRWESAKKFTNAYINPLASPRRFFIYEFILNVNSPMRWELLSIFIHNQHRPPKLDDTTAESNEVGGTALQFKICKANASEMTEMNDVAEKKEAECMFWIVTGS
jgi:hypothetical protein